jgi:hypothetical protein
LPVRFSTSAPAIVGDWQREHEYLPCRMFKNISYGQVGFSNVPKFKDILGEYCIDGSFEEMIEKVLLLKESEYKELVLRQQEIIKKYTYKNALENIFKGFDKLEQKYAK